MQAYSLPLIVSHTSLLGRCLRLKELESVLDSHVVFHLPQFANNVHGVLFARCLLHDGILWSLFLSSDPRLHDR